MQLLIHVASVVESYMLVLSQEIITTLKDCDAGIALVLSYVCEKGG